MIKENRRETKQKNDGSKEFPFIQHFPTNKQIHDFKTYNLQRSTGGLLKKMETHHIFSIFVHLLERLPVWIINLGLP